MRSAPPIPRALRRPLGAARALVAFALLAAPAGVAVRGDDAPAGAGATKDTATQIVLGTPLPPAPPTDAERGVGVVAVEAGAGTVATLRSDGRILVVTGATERVVAPPADAGEFRVFAVAGDGIPVVVTTRGRLLLLEPDGVRRLPLAVQRSAKPAAIPGSRDVVLGSENGSIRRVVRDEGGARLEDVVPPGDEPVGALAAGADRVAYARLDGVVLEAAFAGGAPRELARPRHAVAAVRVIGAKVYVLADGGLAEVGAAAAAPRAPEEVRDGSPRARAVAVSGNGEFAALLVGDAIEVRRLADGARATATLGARTPTSIAFDGDGRTLLVGTSTDARPWRVAIETRRAAAR